MSSFNDPLIEDRKEGKWSNTKITVGLFVTYKVGGMDYNTRYERIKSKRKGVIGCFHYVVENNQF